MCRGNFHENLSGTHQIFGFAAEIKAPKGESFWIFEKASDLREQREDFRISPLDFFQ